MIVSKTQAAKYLIYRTKLNSGESLLEVLEDFGCIQVDPLSVVARNHEMAMYNRVKGFKKTDLDTALYQDRTVFEHWLQVYSFIPMTSFPFLQATMGLLDAGYERFYKQYKAEVDATLAYITEHGATSAKDILHIHSAALDSRWFASVRALLLEHLWYTGQIMVKHRTGNTKYYDLTTRVIPAEYLEERHTVEEGLNFILDHQLRYTGLLRTFSFTRSGRHRSGALREMLKQRVASGEVTPVQVEGTNTKYFIPTSEVAKLTDESLPVHSGLQIISPLDPLIIDRQILLDVFDFFYRWEAYTPAKLRKFGHYNMPILFNGKFVGQIDMAKDLKAKKLVIRNLHLGRDTKKLRAALDKEIKSLERFVFRSD